MAQYRVLVDTAIGNGLVKAGSVIEYDGKSEGKPGANLELIKSPVKTESLGGVDGADSVPGAGA